MIPAFHLEIDVLVLGLVILLVDAFAEKIDKRSIAVAAIVGLGAVLLASFFLSPAPVVLPDVTGFWSFYTADSLAIFFKRFALVTTIFVLVMMIDYAPIVRSTIHGVTAQAGLGEFFALPVFTCAGLMWMASAVDFVMIFVSIELVTMSFYVLVSFTRRNPVALEAGVKYLILSAVSTGFLVYGITWIFGVTGETNLDRIAAALQHVRYRTGSRTFRDGPRDGRARFQNRCRTFPDLGSRCLSRRADSGDRFPLGRFQGRRVCRVVARAPSRFSCCRKWNASWSRSRC